MILSEDDKEYLKSLYYDLEFPASLSGPKKFYQEIKKRNDRPISRAQVDEFLRGEHVYTTNRNIQRKFHKWSPVIFFTDQDGLQLASSVNSN